MKNLLKKWFRKPKLYSIRDIAIRHKLHEGTVRRWANEGKIQGFKISNGKDWVFYDTDVPTFIRHGPKRKDVIDKSK